MPSAELTRSVAFSAAHRYARPEWSDEENRRVFGACANPVGHGHRYAVEVTVRGPIDGTTGFSVDLGVLDALLRREVIEPLDHQHLNHVVDEFRDGRLIPTAENLAVLLWPRIARGLPNGVELRRLRVREDDALWVDYFGEDDGSGGS